MASLGGRRVLGIWGGYALTTPPLSEPIILQNHPFGEITFFWAISFIKSQKFSTPFYKPFLYKLTLWEKFLRYIWQTIFFPKSS